MQIQPYLMFNGRCEEAAQFYCAHLGAEITMMMRFGEIPASESAMVTPGSENKIMHLSLQVGDTVVMMSDAMGEGAPGFEGFSMSLTVPTAAQAERYFALLSEGGEVKMPLSPTFWSSQFGMLTDRFGVEWMITVVQESTAPTIRAAEARSSQILQRFFAEATTRAAVDLETALLNLPADKRNWSAGASARSALDMVAECAIMNAMTEKLIETRVFPADFNFADYTREKAELSQDWEALRALLQTNTARAVAAIGTVPDEALSAPVQGVPGAKTLVDVVAYAYWNMKYHEGQINFIASLLDI